ncbi:hypothetical protein SEA_BARTHOLOMEWSD_32 [Streptomyces phage BartholomewSD]|uniref:Uncharacterized protein n=1 Tax=Streptomyces phage Alvy TaxID=2599888 RepID=A0A5J6TUT8_9CAUD|nr:hypothetical protein KGG89_gp62 [Streptomyces phage Alvy]QAX95482.1 hypothetical protein SEA_BARTHOLOMEWSD_32 [Streptomyces phage BartholomewSD]QFG12442.1 hypothetical protein SEA_ALVY_32 [Streptomyces phage Alvy]
MENRSGVASYGPEGWRGQGELSSPDELITLHVDYGDEDFYIDARMGHKPSDMRSILAQARARGLEPMDADECEPELLEDGTVRIYLVLAEAPAATPVLNLADLQEKRRNSAAKRMTLAFALAASVAAALLLPSPLRYDYFPDHKDQADQTEQYAPTRVLPANASTKGD